MRSCEAHRVERRGSRFRIQILRVRVARVVAETGEATQIHDADGAQRATRAVHAVKLRIACAAPKGRPASPVNVVDSPDDSVPDPRGTPAVRVLVLVE